MVNGEKHIRGSVGSLEPPGLLPTHLHTVYMAYSECLPTLLNPLTERTCFSQVVKTRPGGSDNLAGGTARQLESFEGDWRRADENTEHRRGEQLTARGVGASHGR